MRKEVYTRKPKEPFKKIKEYGKNDRFSKTNKSSKLKSPKDFSRRRFIHLSEYKTFKLFLFLSIVGIISWPVFFQAAYQRYLRNKFEKKGLLEYYLSNESYIDYLSNFIYTHEENIYALNGGYLHFNIYVKSKDVDKKISLDSIHIYPIWSFQKRNDRIDSGVLILETEVEKQEINEKWIYKLDALKYKDIPSSFYQYLQIDSTEIKSFHNVLSKLGWSINFIDNIELRIWNDDFGYYEYILSKNQEYSPKDSIEINEEKYLYYKTGKIRDGVYWRREIEKSQMDI